MTKTKSDFAGCSRMVNPTNGARSIVIAGGIYNGEFSTTTDILDLQTLQWKRGPPLPITLARAQMLEHYNGGVIVIGGESRGNTYRDEIFYLPAESDSWIKLPQRLRRKRSHHVAFPIPDELALCSG